MLSMTDALSKGAGETTWCYTVNAFNNTTDNVLNIPRTKFPANFFINIHLVLKKNRINPIEINYVRINWTGNLIGR